MKVAKIKIKLILKNNYWIRKNNWMNNYNKIRKNNWMNNISKMRKNYMMYYNRMIINRIRILITKHQIKLIS
jgi:hypothetical protein